MRPAIQLYSLRTVEEPLSALVERVGTAGYAGVEFAYRIGDANQTAVRAAMDRGGTEAAGAHVPIDQFETFEATVQTYRELGCETLVVPYLDESQLTDRASVEDAAAKLAALGDRLARRDVAFGYHNHTHEFVSLDGDAGYDVLAAATPPTVDLQVDVGLAALAGREPVALIDRYADRITQVHLKDYDLDAGESVDLGTGDVPIEACVAAAQAADVEWAIVEFESSPDPLASAERSLAALDALL